MSAFRHKSKPFIHLIIEILNRTEEEAHATGKDSSIEGMIGHEATELLYEVLRVKRLSREELRKFSRFLLWHSPVLIASQRFQLLSTSALLHICSRSWSRPEMETSDIIMLLSGL